MLLIAVAFAALVRNWADAVGPRPSRRTAIVVPATVAAALLVGVPPHRAGITAGPLTDLC